MAFILSRAEQVSLNLDQRLKLIYSVSDTEVIYEVFALVEFVSREYLLSSALSDLARQFNDLVEEYRDIERKLMDEAFVILDALYASEPSFRRPDIARANPASPHHELSLMGVEEIRHGKRSTSWKTTVDSDEDHTDGSVVFRGIQNAINGNHALKERYLSSEGGISAKILAVQQGASERETAFKRMMGRRKVHPFDGFRLLYSFYNIAYPNHPRASTWQEEFRRQTTPAQHDWSRVMAALEGEADEKFTLLLRLSAERLVYGLQDRLRRTASMLELIQRFRIRTMWYDKPRLRQLAADLLPGQKNNPVEDKLTKELAMYLFDNGHPVLIKADIENVQLDALGLNTPVLVEAKAYKDSKQRAAVIAGIAQLHAYMNLLEGSKLHVEEAYYVVFRLDGPLYELPSVIHTNRFAIYPVVVDIAESKVSGRKQPKPVILSKEAILASFEK